MVKLRINRSLAIAKPADYLCELETLRVSGMCRSRSLSPPDRIQDANGGSNLPNGTLFTEKSN